jgi:hypothetical protein
MSGDRRFDVRRQTHGNVAETAQMAQTIKIVIRPRAARLPLVQREALDMIAPRSAASSAAMQITPTIGAIIAGYARLVAEGLG